jgi:hypothetical protein
MNDFIIRDDVIVLLQKALYTSWRKYLLSNIQDVELYDISINLNTTDTLNNLTFNLASNKNAILIVTYLIKLDPRITQNSQIIYKIINIINSTLFNPNLSFYKNLSASLSNSSKTIVPLTLTSPQISCNFWKNFFKATFIFAIFYFFYLSNSIISRRNHWGNYHNNS